MLLNKEICIALRGISILFIVSHNYSHWLENVAHENEFTWTSQRFYYFYEGLFCGNFLSIIFNFTSFIGHYGVTIFLFLTGYGLASKYNKNINNPFAFIKTHYIKLFKIMACGYFLYLTITLFYYHSYHNSFHTIIAQLLLITNLFPRPEIAIDPGPYWYLGLTMQLYILYCILVNKNSTKKIIIITFASLTLLFFFRNNFTVLRWFKYNFIGALLPFAIGILLQNYSYHIPINNKSKISICVISFILVILLGRFYISWLLTPLFFITFAISFIYITPSYLQKIFVFIGNYSAQIFIIHPIIRIIFFKEFPNNQLETLIFFCLYLLTSIALSIVYKHITNLVFNTQN